MKHFLQQEVRPTRTPQPTLDNLEAEKIVQQYLRDNRGCKLPCWWEIVPGETTQDEAETFLESIVQIHKIDDGDMISLQYQIPNAPEGFFLSGYISFHEGEVSYIYVFQNATAQRFSLYQLLTDYGKPDQVKLQVYREVFDGYPSFTLLVYQSLGIVAEFDSIAERDGQNLRGCFKGGFDYSGGPNLWLYDASDPKLSDPNLFFPILNIQTEPLAPPVLSIEQAAGIDTETFYQIYKDPENACILTPHSLAPVLIKWRPPGQQFFFKLK